MMHAPPCARNLPRTCLTCAPPAKPSLSRGLTLVRSGTLLCVLSSAYAASEGNCCLRPQPANMDSCPHHWQTARHRSQRAEYKNPGQEHV